MTATGRRLTANERCTVLLYPVMGKKKAARSPSVLRPGKSLLHRNPDVVRGDTVCVSDWLPSRRWPTDVVEKLDLVLVAMES